MKIKLLIFSRAAGAMTMRGSARLAEMNDCRRMAAVPVHVSSIGQVSLNFRNPDVYDVFRVTKDEGCLHALYHVLQDVAMYHPHARVLDSDSPCTPPSDLIGSRRRVVPEKHGGVSLDGRRALQLRLGHVRVELALSGPDIVVMSPVHVPGMRIQGSSRRTVISTGSDILKHDLENLAQLRGVRLRLGIEATVSDRAFVIWKISRLVLIERYEVWLRGRGML